MAKTLEQNFIDWEGHAFGFGYGSGEPHIIPLLKRFLEMCNHHSGRSYDYQELERELGPAQAWFLINVLCRQDLVEYGTSPRGGWLTTQGEALRAFVATKTADELVDIVTEFDSEYIHCYPDACNCGEHGHEAGRKCVNPFWRK